MSESTPTKPNDFDAAPAGSDVAGGDSSWMPNSLTGGSFERVRKNPWTLHTAIIGAAGILLTFYLIKQAGDLRRLPEVFTQSGNHLLGFFLFTNVYLLCKGWALRRAAGYADIRISLLRGGRVFCESSVVGLITAKIASDIYKYTRIGKAPRSARIKAVLLYRVAAILSVLILSAIVSVLWAESTTIQSRLIWLVPVVVIGGLVLGYRSRVSNWLREHGRYLLGVMPFSIAALVAKIGGLAVLLGVSMEGQLIEVAAVFLVIGSLASMAQVPSGLGVQDVGYAVYLTEVAGISGAETALILIALRLLGPLYVAALGAVSIGFRYVERSRLAIGDVSSQPKTA